jgi:hypothetical protein
VDGAEKVSGVWLYAADNIRPGNVVGKVLHRSYYHARILNIDVSRAKKSARGRGKRSGASAHVRRGERRSLRKGYSLIEDRRFDWSEDDVRCIPGFGRHQHFNTGVTRRGFWCITTDRSWRISNKVKGPMSKKSSR